MPTKNKSVAEIRNYTERQEKIKAIRASMSDALVRLVNLTDTNKSKSFLSVDKSKLRTWLKNPLSNEASIREMSQFLYRMSYQYRTMIGYYASMIDLSAYSVIPTINIEEELSQEDSDKKTYLKKFSKTLKQVRKMNLASEIGKCLIIAWREDAFFGYTYEDKDGFFIMPLEGKYCKISSINFDGTLNFAFDFSYFRTYTDDLEYWDDEFKKKYELYQTDMKNYRWQELEHNRTICLKVNNDDTSLVLPPFVQLFNQIIDLIDLQSIQSVKDELSIYKLLVARLETISGSTEVDDFAVDIDTAIDYYNRLAESLPDCVSSVISPLKIDTIEFKGTTTEDTDMIANSMSNLFKAGGCAQVLDAESISNTKGWTAAIQADSLKGISTLLPQIEKWHNRYLENSIRNHCPIKYIRVTPFTKGDVIDQYKDAAQYGIPVKIAYASLLGFDPLETMSLAYLENDCLDLARKWIPLQSSHTQSGSLEENADVDKPEDVGGSVDDE